MDRIYFLAPYSKNAGRKKSDGILSAAVKSRTEKRREEGSPSAKAGNNGAELYPVNQVQRS